MTTVGSISQTVVDLTDKVMGTGTAQAGEEPPSGIQGAGTATEPYDQGNAPENPPKSASETAGTSSQPTTTPTSNASTAPKSAATKATDDRGRNALNAPAKSRVDERDVSPGTLPDGSHAQTSGDRGEGYEPGKLSRLKGKLPFGKH